MNGHTFQCYGETTEKNQYNRTIEELEVYVGAHIEHYGGHIGDDAALIAEEEKKMTADMLPLVPTAEQLKSCVTLAKSKSNAIFFLCCADPGRYALLTTDLENQLTRGNDQYPDNITDAMLC
jgi:hypothetical protein